MHRYLTASQLVALKLHGSLNFNGDIAGRAWHWVVDWVVRLCCAFPVGAWQMAMPIYRIVAYLQASTRTACCLLLGRNHQCSTPSPPTSLPIIRRTCHNFLNAFSLTSWRENFAVKYFAQILFSHAFVALSANDTTPPSFAFPTRPATESCWSCSVNCINARRSFQEFRCLLSFFISFLLLCVFQGCSSPFVPLFSTCVPPCIGIFSAYLYRFRSLCCCLFCFRGCQRAVCNVQRCCQFSLHQILFYNTFFSAISLKRKLEKLHEIFVVPLVVFYFRKVFKSIVPSSL